MKKGLSLLLALCMLAALLTGCRKEEPANLKEDIQKKTDHGRFYRGIACRKHCRVLFHR